MIPKIELHLHLEGAAPPAFVRGLAGAKSLRLDSIFDAAGNYSYRGFNDFLRVYEAATSVIRGPQDYAALLRAVLEEAAEQGAIYVETFVSPEFCGGADLGAWRDHVAAMSEVAVQMAAQGIDSRAIITPIRHFGPERARASARCAVETASEDGSGWVSGFGLAGDETKGLPKDYAWSFDCAREAGLGLTCHAGEWCGPDRIRSTWRDLGVSRLGHGVRAIGDADLVRDLAEAGVTLEVCPGSNVVLGIYPSIADHPIARLVDAGCRVTVSTDDPPFFHTTLGAEYDALADAFGWAEDEFRQMNLWAAEAAFCDAATRQRLKEKVS
ncbi:adenosine deaminase [Paracoccus suum]|uniref:adenosine deaminase n=1 Tax=Paracoccus suum TaxID=2259340 RepID=UPI001F54699E|nr:adenosine deaminase [Paracoccus suum]